MAERKNPLLQEWTSPFEIPPFAEIKPDDFSHGFDVALKEVEAEIDALADDDNASSFDGVITVLEKGGEALRKVSSTFYNLSGAHTNDSLQAIERDMAPRLAAHRSKIIMNAKLFAKIDALYENREQSDFDDEQQRVLQRYYDMFVRAGAKLEGEDRKRMAEITERLATLGTQFAQNMLADEKDFELVLESESDLAGLPQFLLDAASQAASERGHEGKHVITLSRSLIEPFLQFSTRRDLRERAHKGWISRGENGGETDNRAIIAETLQLRHERAKLLGFETFAHFKTENNMAKTPDAVLELLNNVWEPAKTRAAEEEAELQAMIAEEGANFTLQPSDWRHYSEKVRKAKYELNEEEIKPYFQLDKMIAAAFETATRLFGVTFKELDNMPVYHPDVRVFEVLDASGEHVGIFLGDYFARPSKRSGAWMSAFRGQHKLSGEVRPIIVNVMNFAKAPEGQPSLLTYDDARTLFHEFGHGLHGLLSDVTYPMISGTSVERDFVELPSQLFEHWLSTPEILSKYAIHAETGEALPKALLDKLLAAQNFNQGFATVEYTACAIVDMKLHMMEPGKELDILALEKGILSDIGMPSAITMRHRTPHFAHAFAGDGYSAGYYSYMWSEVMDADAFRAFEETGDVFDATTAEKLKTFIYSAGSRRDPAEAYKLFRGSMPNVDALLEGRGLKAA